MVQRTVLFASILVSYPIIFHAHVRMRNSKKYQFPLYEWSLNIPRGWSC